MERVEEHPPLLRRLLEQVPEESILLLHSAELSYFPQSDDRQALAQAKYLRSHSELRGHFQSLMGHYHFISKRAEDIFRDQQICLMIAIARSGFRAEAELFGNSFYKEFVAIRHPELMQYAA